MSAQKGIGALIRSELVGGPKTTDELIQAVVAQRPEASAASVRARLAKLTDAGKILRIERGLYGLLGAKSLNLAEANVLTRLEAAIEALLVAYPETRAPDGYTCIPFAVTDAVFSARQRYSTIVPMMKRIEAHFSESLKMPDPSVEQFLEVVNPGGLSRPPSAVDDPQLKAFFGMATISPGTQGIPKARTTVAVLYRLFEDRLTTIAEVSDLDQLMGSLDGIRGNHDRIPGVGWITARYITMLLGDKDRVKPDIHVVRWVKEVIGVQGWSPGSPEDVADLVEEAARRVIKKRPELTVGDIDSTIWGHMAGRSTQSRRSSAPPRQDYTYFADGTEVDWDPRRPRQTAERWHGKVIAQARPGRVVVEWTLTDSTRPTELSRTGSYTQEVSTMDLVACTIGASHPGRHGGLDAGVTMVDWSPIRPDQFRKHGRVEFVDTESDAILVRWLVQTRDDSPEPPDNRPRLQLVRRRDVSICDPSSDRHPTP